jgi:hypothetical protein
MSEMPGFITNEGTHYLVPAVDFQWLLTPLCSLNNWIVTHPDASQQVLAAFSLLTDIGATVRAVYNKAEEFCGVWVGQGSEGLWLRLDPSRSAVNSLCYGMVTSELSFTPAVGIHFEGENRQVSSVVPF